MGTFRTSVLAAIVAVLSGLACVQSALAFHTNSRHWDALPVVFFLDESALPPATSAAEAHQWIQTAAAGWTAVPCSNVSVLAIPQGGGGWRADGVNSIFWVTEGWLFGPDSAGATLWIPTAAGDPPEVDIALNAEYFSWVPGGADATVADVVDPVSVLIHEMGHALGLSHTEVPHATMFMAMLPNGTQASLAADDQLGICSLYPDPDVQATCGPTAECPNGAECQAFESWAVCEEPRLPTGSQCSKTQLECDGLCVISLYECSSVCVFTDSEYNTGYCAPLCLSPDGVLDQPCPAGWTCTPQPALEGSVCIRDAPEAAPSWWESASDPLRRARCRELVEAPPGSLPHSATREPDAAMPDAATPDAAMPDAATPDAATPDAATPDAAQPNVPSGVDTSNGSPDSDLPTHPSGDSGCRQAAGFASDPATGPGSGPPSAPGLPWLLLLGLPALACPISRR